MLRALLAFPPDSCHTEDMTNSTCSHIFPSFFGVVLEGDYPNTRRGMVRLPCRKCGEDREDFSR